MPLFPKTIMSPAMLQALKEAYRSDIDLFAARSSILRNIATSNHLPRDTVLVVGTPQAEQSFFTEVLYGHRADTIITDDIGMPRDHRISNAWGRDRKRMIQGKAIRLAKKALARSRTAVDRAKVGRKRWRQHVKAQLWPYTYGMRLLRPERTLGSFINGSGV